MKNYQIKELPLEDRPREKLMQLGASNLTTSELLAILLRNGTKEKSALALARELVDSTDKLRQLAQMTRVDELIACKGIGPVKAITIMAALELGKRVALAEPMELTSITNPDACAAVLMPILRYKQEENFVAVLLNTKSKVMQVEYIARGSLNSAVVHPREVFAPAIINHAAAILVGHNHPSGDPTPSKEDRELTNSLVSTGKVMGIPVVDHIVIGDGIYFSFREHGYI